MTDVGYILRNHALAIFRADPTAAFATMLVTPEQVVQMVYDDQIYDAVPLNFPGQGFPGAAVGPQWAIMERSHIEGIVADVNSPDNPTALLVPQEFGDPAATVGLCGALWEIMNQAHLEGHTLVDWFDEYPETWTLFGFTQLD